MASGHRGSAAPSQGCSPVPRLSLRRPSQRSPGVTGAPVKPRLETTACSIPTGIPVCSGSCAGSSVNHRAREQRQEPVKERDQPRSPPAPSPPRSVPAGVCDIRAGRGCSRALPGLQRPRPRAQDGPGAAGARAGRGRAAPGISHTDNHRRACSAAPRGLAGMCRWSPGCAELAPPLAGPGGFRELRMHDRDQPQPSVRQQAHPARARPRFTIRTPPAEARDRSGCVPEPRPTRDNPG